ncbi:MAG: S8 family peptidase [Armatimonadota bacterium]|nr:S8 family peptidase [Armatimonadota bacterium]
MRALSIGRLAAALAAALVVSSCGSGFQLGPPPTMSPAAGAASGDFVPDELLVRFRPGASAARIAGEVGASVVDRIGGIDVHVLRVEPARAEVVLQALSRNPNVEYAERNGIATLFADPNDPYDNTTCYESSKHGCVMQWGWEKVQAYAAWDFTTGSGTVRIAVVDTGIDNSHEDLPPVAAQRDFVNNDNNAEDDNGHGTHVAGTIGALTNNGKGVAGANWAVSLLGVKVLSATGSGSYSAVANGIVWAADQGAKAINLSLGGSLPSSTLRNAVDYAWNKGAVLACAAGNSGTKQKTYPAAYTNCIAVAATDENDNKASFSNYGADWVDVAAPGVRILSTMPDTVVYLNSQYGYKTLYDSLNGTPMATPHVAGQAGLIWARGQCTSASCVRNKIESTADPIPGTGNYWKWGRVNYHNSVK